MVHILKMKQAASLAVVAHLIKLLEVVVIHLNGSGLDGLSFSFVGSKYSWLEGDQVCLSVAKTFFNSHWAVLVSLLLVNLCGRSRLLVYSSSQFWTLNLKWSLYPACLWFQHLQQLLFLFSEEIEFILQTAQLVLVVVLLLYIAR